MSGGRLYGHVREESVALLWFAVNHGISDAMRELHPEIPKGDPWTRWLLDIVHIWCGPNGEKLHEKIGGPVPTYRECIAATAFALQRGWIRHG